MHAVVYLECKEEYLNLIQRHFNFRKQPKVPEVQTDFNLFFKCFLLVPFHIIFDVLPALSRSHVKKAESNPFLRPFETSFFKYS